MASGRARRGSLAVCWLVLVGVLSFSAQGPAAADDSCERRPLDPRSGRLHSLGIEVTWEGITGRVKNQSTDTALGVRVWVNYYISRRGGLAAQQCILVGDLSPGEERDFQASPLPEVENAEAYAYTVDALGWR
jgi:hypothetical protein